MTEPVGRLKDSLPTGRTEEEVRAANRIKIRDWAIRRGFAVERFEGVDTWAEAQRIKAEIVAETKAALAANRDAVVDAIRRKP